MSMVERKCLYPACGETKIYSRGLCPNCYGAASRLIRSGKVTWDVLVDSGKALETGNNSKPSPRSKWFLNGGDDKEKQ